MSELINSRDNRATIRWKLLTSASALALTAYVSSASIAGAEDTDHPQVWIELGAQLERASGGDSAYTAPFFSHLDASIQSPAAIVNELSGSLGPEGKISFQPEGSDWIFSASIRYGRAKSKRSTLEHTKAGELHVVTPYIVRSYYTSGGIQYYRQRAKCCNTYSSTPSKANFAGARSNHEERHTILDFQAGKDVGLGLFGQQSTSVLGAGVRFAQFQSKMDASVKARADLQRYNAWNRPGYSYFLGAYPQKYRPATRFKAYSLTAGSARDTKLIGPSISWNASATLAGNSDTSELTFDWGVNGAILFGKQKASTHHQSSGNQFYKKYNSARHIPTAGYSSIYDHPRVDHIRSRSVTVPNVGGMAGFSIKFPNAKVSIGYRADYFFGAMDGGWDTYKSQTRSFMGPFASISVGLGD